MPAITPTAQGDSEVTSSKCKKTTALLSVSLTAQLLFLVAYVVLSLTKLSELEEGLTKLTNYTFAYDNHFALIDEKLNETNSTGIFIIQLFSEFIIRIHVYMHMLTITKIQLEYKTKIEVERFDFINLQQFLFHETRKTLYQYPSY